MNEKASGFSSQAVRDGLEARGVGLDWQMDRLAECLKESGPKEFLGAIFKLWKIFGLSGEPEDRMADAIARLTKLAGQAEEHRKEDGFSYRQ